MKLKDNVRHGLVISELPPEPRVMMQCTASSLITLANGMKLKGGMIFLPRKSPSSLVIFPGVPSSSKTVGGDVPMIHVQTVLSAIPNLQYLMLGCHKPCIQCCFKQQISEIWEFFEIQSIEHLTA
jgi:hypothetical protein